MTNLRKKRMPKLTEREQRTFILDKEGIRAEAQDEYDYIQIKKLKSGTRKHPGGRPRKDNEAAIADELRSQGKEWSEVQTQIDPKNQENNTADAYRKLVASRKAKAASQTG